MKCGFCGQENPDKAKRCSRCGAHLKSQKLYASPMLPGGRQPKERNLDSENGAKKLMIYTIVIPLIIAVCIIAYVCAGKILSKRFKDGNQGTVDSVLQKELQNYHNLARSEYKVVPESEDEDNRDFRLVIADREYQIRDCGTNETKDWRSDYFTSTFQRKVRDYVKDIIAESGLLQETDYVVITKVEGLLPLWVNPDEMERVLTGQADGAKWRQTWETSQSWTSIVMVQLQDTIPVSEEIMAMFAKQFFFATTLEISCPNVTYSYDPAQGKLDVITTGK